MTSTAGSDARTNVIYAIDRLKEKFPASVPFEDLIAYVLPAEKRQHKEQVQLIKRFLAVNGKVTYNPSENSYKFRPLHNIATADDLLAYFQKQDTALGLQVRELKDGWVDAETVIDQLEAEHKLLVTRNKKDGHARMVWPNDPSLVAPLDQDFKDLFNGTALLSTEDVIKELTRMNYTPTGELQKIDNVAKVEKKKKKVRRGAKVTNTHMAHLLRDYSDKRPQGTK